MNCTLSHSIVLKNVQENNFHEIILLSGSINSCDNQSVEIESHGETVKVELFNKNFKALIKLIEGGNEVTLRYCQHEMKINLNYLRITPVIYDIQPLYIIPKDHDGTFQGISKNSAHDAMQKINLSMKLTQCVIAAKLDGKSFVLNECEIFHSSLSVEFMRCVNQFELYDAIAEELIEKFGSDLMRRRKFVGFVSCTRFLGLGDESYSYENIKNKTQANPALGMSFLALLGSGTFYSFPSSLEDVQKCFNDKTQVDTKILLDDSNYRKTFGGNFSTSLGSLLHEIGHIFDLGHTQTGIMGNDVDFVHRFFICESFTEIMPKRLISKCQKSSEIKINSNSRLTKIKKGGEYLEKYREQKNNDMTFFEQNCMLTLSYHKWFTQDKSESKIEFDESEKILKSSDELANVELRDEDSLLVKFYDLTKDDTRMFQLPFDVSLEKMTLFAISKTGCIYKK